MMMGMATKSLKLEAGKGVEFYKFDSIASPKKFIEEWYSQVNTLPLSAEEKEELIEEANVVFRFNIAIFEELEGNGFKVAMSLALVALRDKFKSAAGIFMN